MIGHDLQWRAPADSTVTLRDTPSTMSDAWSGGWPDLDRPNVARMYDYLLDGSHNFHPDRAAVHRLLAEVPQARLAARASRGFFAAAVRFLLASGVRQFLDIGAGLPTHGSVHEIARKASVPTRVVYVDVDPVVVMHTRAVIAGNGRAGAVLGDLRRPLDLLDHPAVRGLLNLSRPVAVLLGGVLQFLSDADDPAGVVATLRDALAPGSYVMISHVVDGGCGGPEWAADVFEATGMPLAVRRRDQVRSLFAGMDLISPGAVPAGRWCADEDTDPLHSLALPVMVGVGRVPRRRPRRRGGGRVSIGASTPAGPPAAGHSRMARR